ncbi:hypothetical protein ACVIW3_003575 [Bradyrhizobium diazoefficiens]
MGIRFRKLGRELRKPACRRDRRRRSTLAHFAIDDDQRTQARVLARLCIEARAEFGLGHRDGRAGIGEIELQQIRRRQRVDQERHEAGTHGAEEGGGISRRIVEEQQHAIATLEAERDEAVAPAASLRAELGICARARRTNQRELVAISLAEIVEQHAAGVVDFRNGKADLACARAVRGHLVANLVAHAVASLAASPPFLAAS